MGIVFDFNARRITPKPTIIELADNAVHYLLTDWEKMAKLNRLNDYFLNTVPNLRNSEKSNFMSDLNEISALELNIEFFPIILSPGALGQTQLGWIVQFTLGNTSVFSTPELACEAYARCFAILLYLKLKRDALAAGITF